jgi:peptidoglycan hydrolase CwlO-like protein
MHENPLESLEKVALSVTRAVGSVWSLIIHTIIFIVSFSLVFFGIRLELVLLVLTTILSLEAIYLSIFIQLSVNHQARAIASVEKDIDEIQEDVEEIAEDVEEIAEDMEEMQEDIDEIQEDVEEIAEDVEEITEEQESEKKV